MFRPALLGITGARFFSHAIPSLSYIGKAPVRLLPDVECFAETIPLEFCKTFTKGKQTFSLDRLIVVKGPKGTVRTAVPSFVRIKAVDGAIEVSVKKPENKLQRAMWGTSRALIQNNVIGTSEGHLSIVKFVGTGYRAALEEKDGDTYVVLRIGFPYTPKIKVPSHLLVSSPNPARLIIEGIDKQQVKLFAARIREFRKPEPYKGKGIYVDDETIKLKQKKIK